MKPLSKTAAIRQTVNVGSIHGRGTSWTVYGPWDVTDLSGPSTAHNTDSYPKARNHATAWRAEAVLALMGKLDNPAAIAIDMAAHDCDYYGPKNLHALINVGLEATLTR